MRVAEPGRLVEPDRAQEFGDAAVERDSLDRGRLSPWNLGE